MTFNQEFDNLRENTELINEINDMAGYLHISFTEAFFLVLNEGINSINKQLEPDMLSVLPLTIEKEFLLQESK